MKITKRILDLKDRLPGCIYKNGRRWWWKVRFPGDVKYRFIGLVPVGGRKATADYDVAVEVAAGIWERILFDNRKDKMDFQPKEIGKIEIVSDLVAAYHNHARGYYVNQRNPEVEHVEVYNVKLALQELLRDNGGLEIDLFGARKLKEVQADMVDRGLSIRTIKGRINTIRRAFKWAASEELIPAGLWHRLMTVEGLRRGRTTAPGPRHIEPADLESVNAVLEIINPILGNLIRVQQLAGMRPGEAVIMRPMDLEERSIVNAGKIVKLLVYTPEFHKTELAGGKRIIPLGPRARKIIEKYLNDRGPEVYCFSPAEAEKIRMAGLHKKRITPIGYGNRPGTNRKDDPQWNPGDHYTTASYRKAVTRCMDHINKDREKPLARWTPNQLRHSTGDMLKRKYGIEKARAVLGHSSAATTEIYVEQDVQTAMELAIKEG